MNNKPHLKLDKPISIAEYIELINELLKEVNVKIIGEVTEAKQSVSGHVYFTLKDKDSGAVLDCVIWASNYRLMGIKLEKGMQIIATGYGDVYKNSGRFTFKASTLELVGQGALRKAYEKLKLKLDKEGLFIRESRIPEFVETVGLITSKSGVVKQDFMRNLKPFGFKIYFHDARVEGVESLPTLIKAIDWFNNNMKDIDLLIIMRGGGSKATLEDLQTFNNEVLARTIFDSKVPVLCAIGHDVNIPIASLVGDDHVSTPSMAAVKLNESWERLADSLPHLEYKIISGFQGGLQDYRSRAKFAVEKIINAFKQVFRMFDSLRANLKDYFVKLLQETNNIIINSEKHLKAFDPERNLKLGYSIVKGKDNKIIKNTNQLRIGEKVTTKLYKGSFLSKVSKLKQKQKQ